MLHKIKYALIKNCIYIAHIEYSFFQYFVFNNTNVPYCFTVECWKVNNRVVLHKL